MCTHPATSRNLPGLTLSKTRGNRPLCFQMFKVRKYSTVGKIKVSNYKNLIVLATQLFRAWEPIKTERYIGWLNQLASPLCCCCLIKCFQHFNILTSVQFLRTINIPCDHKVQNRAAIYKVMAAPWGQWHQRAKGTEHNLLHNSTQFKLRPSYSNMSLGLQ